MPHLMRLTDLQATAYKCFANHIFANCNLYEALCVQALKFRLITQPTCNPFLAINPKQLETTWFPGKMVGGRTAGKRAAR